MSLAELEKISITQFKGLFQRGLDDACPPDHSTVAQNLRYNRTGEAFTRDGLVSSLVIGTNITRIFVANFGHDNAGIILTCDGAGNIYRSDTNTVLLNVTDMVDFIAYDVFGFCLISPILSSAALSSVYIWQASESGGSDPIPIRVAAGVGPGTGMAGAEDASVAGNCAIGVHQFAVSFITNSGYTTQPGPLGSPTPPLPENPTFASVSVTSTGGFSIHLTSIPTGGSEVTARQILATQADQDLFFYAGGQIWNGSSYDPWDGTIQDNTTTSIIISFFDTDLAVSADSLFDLLPAIPGGIGLIAGITTYHGRVLYWGGEYNLIRVTSPGSSETIDNIAGFIQLPDQFDGNDAVSSCTLQDTLYFFKEIGIFSITDNGGDPDTWSIIAVDSGVGCSSSHALSSLDLTTLALNQNQVILTTDLGGVYVFNGTIIQPPLTWKINDLWLNIGQYNSLSGSKIAVDPFNKLIYVAILGNPVDEPGYPNLLVADYNDGLDSQNIKWSIWTFPFVISDIGMAFFTDSSESNYRLRVASGDTIYKIFPGALDDISNPIVCVYRSYSMAPEQGALNIFRYLRARMPYYDSISLNLIAQDGVVNQSIPGFNTPYIPGRDLTREFNFMDEKCEVQICCNALAGGFILQRLDVFCKVRFGMRPSV